MLLIKLLVPPETIHAVSSMKISVIWNILQNRKVMLLELILFFVVWRTGYADFCWLFNNLLLGGQECNNAGWHIF
jgi:hypothetical protein